MTGIWGLWEVVLRVRSLQESVEKNETYPKTTKNRDDLEKIEIRHARLLFLPHPLPSRRRIDSNLTRFGPSRLRNFWLSEAFLRIPRRKRRFLKKSYYSLGKIDNFLIFTDFSRFLGLSWETSTLKNYHPEDSEHSGSRRLEFSSKSTTFLM